MSRVMARLFMFTELYRPLVLSPLCSMSGLRTAGGTGAPTPRHMSGRVGDSDLYDIGTQERQQLRAECARPMPG